MSKTSRIKKDELVSELREVRAAICTAVRQLPLEKQDQVFLGNWCIKDLLAHLVGWDRANLAAISSVRSGQVPDFYHHYDADWRSYNAQLVAEYRRDDLEIMLNDVEVSHKNLVDAILAVPETDLAKDFGVRFKGYKVTIARLVQAETKDERVHRLQIQEGLGV